MFWNLVTVHYEKYNLHHVLYFILLILYSILGGMMFHWIEGNAEEIEMTAKNTELVRKSVAAKRILVESVQKIYFAERNRTDFYETKLRIALDAYDRRMGLKPERLKERKWTIWGGLYYAGTIYTTIGYGDLAATTFWGRIMTMVYAVFGIPMVVTILNDWGTLLFNLIEKLWVNYVLVCSKKCALWCTRRKQKKKEENAEEALIEECCGEERFHDVTNPDEKEPIPLIVVLIVLVLWVLMCCSIFLIFEEWTFFESIYFFFISLTTIGFGDITPSHKVAVANFIFILMGLSIVSMSINIIQMNLEMIFAQIVASIDQDFKANLEDGAADQRCTNGEEVHASMAEHLEQDGGDVIKEYSKNMNDTQKFFMRFMSNHQKQMLNEKFEDRAKMRNKYTQTARHIKTTSVQTQDKNYEDYCDYDENEKKPTFNSQISTKRLYIYNTGFD